MRSDTARLLPAALAALSLALPVPAVAHQAGPEILICGGGTLRLPLPGRRDQPDENDCRLACHAALCRKRGGLPGKDCDGGGDPA